KCMASAPPAARHLSQVAVARPLASHGRLIAGVLVAGVLVRLLLAGLVPLFGDEAYYWEWSRHLAPGYFDHPPGIALLIRGGTTLAAAGLVLATPDSPLLATTAVSVYAVVRALQEASRSRASLGWWTVTGISLGLAFCSKYTSILMPAGVLIAVLSRASLRVRL